MEKKGLVEIKKGQTGTGLLMESDGFISMDLGNNRKLFEDINDRILVGTDNHGLWQMTSEETLSSFHYNDPSMNIEFAKVRSFAADKEGNLSEYPEDFMDEWTAQMMQQHRLRLREADMKQEVGLPQQSN